MPGRYLFGPVSATFANKKLHRHRQQGLCLAFNADGDADVTVRFGDSWDDVLARLPAGRGVDFLVVHAAYTSVPECLWTAPVPLVAVAPDHQLLWHYYRRRLRACDLILTDRGGQEALARAGIAQARAVYVPGCDRSVLEAAPAEATRDIDVLVVHNLNPAVHPERVAWLTRLARLGERWRIAIHPGVMGEACRGLFRRSRIVFHCCAGGPWNELAFEAAAAGALVFQDAASRERPDWFRDGHECVLFDEANLEALLEHYLSQEGERRRLVEEARQALPRCGFDQLWETALSQVEAEWPDLLQRRKQRRPPGEVDALLSRCLQLSAATRNDDANLVHDLEVTLRAQPESAALHNALGQAILWTNRNPALARTSAEVSAEHFQRAVSCRPDHLLARLNLAEALAAAGEKARATAAARQALAALEQSGALAPSCLDGLPFRADYGFFRIACERAAWANAGRPADELEAKRKLLRGRLYALLAQLTGDVVSNCHALLADPDALPLRAALGCALASAGQMVEALPHLRRVVADNPFDREAARALFAAAGAIGDSAGQRRLARDRWLLHQAMPQVLPAEPWFTEAPPAGDELASLIILCCNQLDYTRLCLESVLRWTRTPYELVLVDNGSTDGTPAYLEEVRARPGPARVVVIRNEENRGFPAGCNQALTEARGRYLLFLNNDTVVTEGWLAGLIHWAVSDWPKVGLVGPVTSAAPEPQGIPVPYTSLDGLDAFAAARRRQYAGKPLETRRVTGFCLLVRREVLEQVGHFDERYGLGFFDDDDLCIRARQAGFRLLVAQDVFVHHFGNRTFQGLGINVRGQLVANFERFRQKWGPEHTAGYHLPEGTDGIAGPVDAPLLVPARAKGSARPRCSLCMIVKNEEPRLPNCLRTAADLFDEVIVVDTGSTDRTREAAARFGAKVYDFPWVDSFGAARNESLRHATGRWVLWLDGDDVLDEENRQRLRELLGRLGDEKDAYAMKVRSVLDPGRTAFRLLDQIRLFPNLPGVQWQYRVHEQILPAVRQQGGDVRWADVIIDHTGYQDQSVRQKKLERNLRLLELDDAEKPDDAFTLFNLGWTSLDLGHRERAVDCLRRSLERSTPDSSIARKLYDLLAHVHRQLGQPEEALSWCRKGLKRYPDDGELLLQEALLLREAKDLAGAAGCLVRLLDARPGRYFASVDAGLRGHKTRHLLGEIYRDQERLTEAELQWRAAVSEQPDFAPAWLALGELYLKQGRWRDVDRVAERLGQPPLASPDGQILRARAHLLRKEFPDTRRILEEVIAGQPGSQGPRVLLSHALLQEGRDWHAAERVLRELLQLNPEHAEARHNLRVLLQQQGREHEGAAIPAGQS
jgi:GT2 family glycosyltransferase/predicted Zn-dependent protease